MARKYHSGTEMQNTAAEVTSAGGGDSISTAVKRTGVSSHFSNHAAVANTSTWQVNLQSTNSTSPGYQRIYIYVVQLPSVTTSVLAFYNNSNVIQGSIALNTDGTFALLAANGTQIGSASSAISLDTWYILELMNDPTVNPGTLEARFGADDGSTPTTFASGTNSLRGTWGRARIGNITSCTVVMHFDDWAVNDSSGSVNNSWLGHGAVLALRPNAAGDSNQWLRTDGSAGTTNNFQLVDERPPNTTDYIKSNTLDDLDLYNIEAPDSVLPAGATIRAVLVTGRLTNDVAADAATATRMVAKQGGTQVETSDFIPNGTSYELFNPVIALMLETAPDGSAWTFSNLDELQIGAKLSATGTNPIKFTHISAMVEFTPSSIKRLPLLGAG